MNTGFEDFFFPNISIQTARDWKKKVMEPYCSRSMALNIQQISMNFPHRNGPNVVGNSPEKSNNNNRTERQFSNNIN